MCFINWFTLILLAVNVNLEIKSVLNCFLCPLLFYKFALVSFSLQIIYSVDAFYSHGYKH